MEELIKYLLANNWHEDYAGYCYLKNGLKVDLVPHEKKVFVSFGDVYVSSGSNDGTYIDAFNHCIKGVIEKLSLTRNSKGFTWKSL